MITEAKDLQVLFENKFRTLDKAGAGKYFKTHQIFQFINEAVSEYFSYLAKRFEIDEESKIALANYTKRIGGAPYHGSVYPISNTSAFFNFSISASDEEKGTFYKIVQEYGVITDTQTVVKIKPITHDYYNANKDNVFKKPNDEIAWRLTYTSTESDANNIHGEPVIEIISKDGNIDEYYATILLKPNDITSSEKNKLYFEIEDIYKIIDLAVHKAAQTLGLNAGSTAENV